MIETIRIHLRKLALLHLQSRDVIITARDENLKQQLQKLTPEQYLFWFQDQDINGIESLNSAPVHHTLDIAKTQLSNPPYGILHSGEMLYRSSGSSGNLRVNHYFSWDNWLEYLIACSRGLMMFGVNSTDTIMTTDIGNLQIGYRNIEDAASLVWGAKVIKSGGTTWEEKLELIQENSVTVLFANVTKLKRMGALIKDPNQIKSLRFIVQLGEHLTDEDREIIKNQFNVEVHNSYGSIEMGQISFTCSAGQAHVHEDLVHIRTENNQSFFSKLVSLPIFNTSLSNESLTYSYKKQCECGSFLATIDEFRPRTGAINKKE